MNARISRFVSGLLVLAAMVLGGCDIVPRQPVLVPSHVQPYPYGGYGSAAYGRPFHSPQQEQVQVLVQGRVMNFHPENIPRDGVILSGPDTGDRSDRRLDPLSAGRLAPWQMSQRELVHPAVLSTQLVTANQQLAIHCGIETIRASAATEAAITGVAGAVVGGALGGPTGIAYGATVGVGLGAAAANRRSDYDCQRVVDWHYRLLMQLSRSLQDQDNKKAWCNYVEREGKTSRICNELVIAPRRDGK